MLNRGDVSAALPNEEAAALQVYSFGDVEVDVRRHVVVRAGQSISLEPKAFEVLRYLLEHRDRLVTKDELMDAVWKDVFVTPNVLTRAVAQMRKALGDDARDAKYIETVSKLGYRFLAPSLSTAPSSRDEPAGDMRDPTPRREWILWAAGILAVVVVAIVWRASQTPRGNAASPPLVQRLTSSGDVIEASVSPDGRYLAYVRASGGQQSLWVRQVNSANAVQLVPPAPVGYWGTTFSRDGSSVYYAIKGPTPLVDPGGTLFRVPVLPGPPQRLFSVIDSHVTFSPDGRRLAFIRVDPDGSGSSSLMIADSDGQQLRALATRRPPVYFAPIFFGAPSWSPDGARIAAPQTDRSTGESRLVTIDVADGAEHRVAAQLGTIGYTSWLPDGSGLVFSGTERLRFAGNLGAQIWLQPYPVGTRRRITAAPAEYRTASVSRDGKSIVAVGMDPASTLWVAPLQGGEAKRLSSVRSDGQAGAAWVGSRVVFTSYDSGTPQLWIMDADGSNRRQLTAEGWNAWPATSPDGGAIFFVSARSGLQGIWRMDAEGRGAQPIARVAEVSNLTVTADGAWIVFSAPSDGQPATWRVPVIGGEPTLIARGLTRAAPSHDGRFVAGIFADSTSGTLALAVIPISGGAPTHRFSPMPLTTTGVGAVEWTPDDQALLFTAAERMNIWKQTLKGGPAERVTTFQDGGVFGFRISPDDRQLLVAHGSNSRDAFLITGF